MAKTVHCDGCGASADERGLVGWWKIDEQGLGRLMTMRDSEPPFDLCPDCKQKVLPSRR